MSLMENATILSHTIGTIIKEISTMKIILWSIYFLVVTIVVNSAFDYFYNNSEYTRAERKIELLLKIKESVKNEQLLMTVDSALVSTVRTLDIPRKQLNLELPFEQVMKILSGVLIPILIIFGNIKSDGIINIIAGSLFLALISAGIALWIPIILSIYLNVALILVVQIIFLIWLVKKTDSWKT